MGLMEDFAFIRRIDDGANSETFEVMENSTGIHFAAKILNAGRKPLLKDETLTQEEFVAAIKKSRGITSDYVCNGFLLEEEDKLPVLIEELMDKTLEQVLLERKLSEFEVISYGKQIALAIRDCHKIGFIHGDIKPNNLGLKGNRIKIFDFGTKKGGLLIRAPELFNGPDNISFKGDIWAFGIVLYKMLTGEYPLLVNSIYKDSDLPVLFYVKREEFIKYILGRLNSDEYYNDIFKNLESKVHNKYLIEIIKKCLQKDPNKRFTSMEEIIFIFNNLAIVFSSKN